MMMKLIHAEAIGFHRRKSKSAKLYFFSILNTSKFSKLIYAAANRDFNSLLLILLRSIIDLDVKSQRCRW
jgi:hypothetical protein